MVSSAPEGLETSWLSIPTAYAVGFILVPLCGGCCGYRFPRLMPWASFLCRYAAGVRCLIVRCVIDGLLFSPNCSLVLSLLFYGFFRRLLSDSHRATHLEMNRGRWRAAGFVGVNRWTSLG